MTPESTQEALTLQVFDSWSEEYRRPFGAVEQRCPVHFQIWPSKGEGTVRARLRVWPDGGVPMMVEMQRLDGDADSDCFYAAYALGRPGLYWYDFELDTAAGHRYVTPCGGGCGAVTAQPSGVWQLTVYAAGFETPGWLKGGVIYQIMPDRFANEGGLPAELPAGRFLRGDWGGIPEYRGDEEGRYLNNTYFGGNLRGIASKLGYLHSLGVTAIYLNPIFEAHSNHRYNTADYRKIDPMLGDEADFRRLCAQAGRMDIRIILDGVFSHTGDDSRYFNRAGRYPEPGAYQSESSPYSAWYDFRRWPDDYRCWWGYKTLPEVKETEPSYLGFIAGPDGVLEHWQRAGAAGWRLDVADELPGEFIRRLRDKVKSVDPEAAVIGEVWEDASRKVSYGVRRPYLEGAELDSVMNYPFRASILAFLKNADAAVFGRSVMTLLEHYPKPCVDVLMNLLGTHDTARILTALAGESGDGRDRSWKAAHHLSAEQRSHGLRLVRLAAVLQFFLPGVPCVYYGDEAGFEGYDDPFNRRCYRWGEEDAALLAFYRRLGALRAACPALREGRFRLLTAEGGLIVFERADGQQPDRLLCAVNAGQSAAEFALPPEFAPLFDGEGERRGNRFRLGPESFGVFGAGGWPDNLPPG